MFRNIYPNFLSQKLNHKNCIFLFQLAILILIYSLLVYFEFHFSFLRAYTDFCKLYPKRNSINVLSATYN